MAFRQPHIVTEQHGVFVAQQKFLKDLQQAASHYGAKGGFDGARLRIVTSAWGRWESRSPAGPAGARPEL
jgi:hypothetical protein